MCCWNMPLPYVHALSPHGLRARLGTFDYVERTGRPSRPARLLPEDPDDAASRTTEDGNGRLLSAQRKWIRLPRRVQPCRIMIGNTDWSMRQGPPAATAVIISDPRAANAQTASSPYPMTSTRRIRQRAVRRARRAARLSPCATGSIALCMHNTQALAAAGEFRAKKPQVMSVWPACGARRGRRRGAAAISKTSFATLRRRDVRKRVLRPASLGVGPQLRRGGGALAALHRVAVGHVMLLDVVPSP